MNTLLDRIGPRLAFTFLASVVSGVAVTPALAQSDWVDGDVFVGTVSGHYKVYSHAGVFEEELACYPKDPSFYGDVEAAAFGGNGSLYAVVTGDILTSEDYVDWFVALDEVHPHSRWLTHNVQGQDITPRSIAFDAQGRLYLCTYDGLFRYSATGTYQAEYDADLDPSLYESPRLALAPDQHTLFYAKFDRIKRIDVATNTQLSDAFDLPTNIWDFVLLSPFDGSGGVIATGSGAVQRYDAAGGVVFNYDAPDYGEWSVVSLDPDGETFWTAGRLAMTGSTRALFQFDIESGSIVQGPLPLGNTAVRELLVRGELVGGSTAPQFDAPTPCDRSLHAYVGVPFTFAVSGSDINVGDLVSMTAVSLPTGATMTPSLPVSGNPAQSSFDWTPAANQVGEHFITFKVTDFVGHERECTLTLTVEPGTPYCFGDGLDPVVTATCPCGNDGASGHGCANSNSTLGGAKLSATGVTSPNTVVLTCTGVNNNTLCTFFRGPNHDPQASVFGDGIKCINPPIFRFGQQNSGQGGNDAFSVAVPAPTELPGSTFHYAVHYRNPVGGFCLPALFNASNGYTIGW